MTTPSTSTSSFLSNPRNLWALTDNKVWAMCKDVSECRAPIVTDDEELWVGLHMLLSSGSHLTHSARGAALMWILSHFSLHHKALQPAKKGIVPHDAATWEQSYSRAEKLLAEHVAASKSTTSIPELYTYYLALVRFLHDPSDSTYYAAHSSLGRLLQRLEQQQPPKHFAYSPSDIVAPTMTTQLETLSAPWCELLGAVHLSVFCLKKGSSTAKEDMDKVVKLLEAYGGGAHAAVVQAAVSSAWQLPDDADVETAYTIPSSAAVLTAVVDDDDDNDNASDFEDGLAAEGPVTTATTTTIISSAPASHTERRKEIRSLLRSAANEIREAIANNMVDTFLDEPVDPAGWETRSEYRRFVLLRLLMEEGSHEVVSKVGQFSTVFDVAADPHSTTLTAFEEFLVELTKDW
eukprot:PhM_4_TR5155/c0_g1_i2/m.23012